MKIADIESSISILFLLRSKFLCEPLSSSQSMYTSNILVKYLMGRFASPKMVITTIHCCCVTSFKACFWILFVSPFNLTHYVFLFTFKTQGGCTIPFISILEFSLYIFK
jgi:hypothetical protein